MKIRKGKARFISLILIIFIITMCFSGCLKFKNMIYFGTVKASAPLMEVTELDIENGTGNNTEIIGNGSNAEIRLTSTSSVKWIKKHTATSPCARSSFGFAYIYGTDKILLFGGANVSPTVYDDTWIYDLSDNKWTQKNPKNHPSGRCHHDMASVWGDDKVVLFGGYNFYKTLYSVWIYDLSEDNWTKKDIDHRPSAHFDHTMVSVYCEDQVAVFGGYYGSDQSWIYDLSENIWIDKTHRPYTNGYPSGRRHHSMAAYWNDDKAVVYSGWPRYDNKNVYIWDIGDNTWLKKTTQNYPKPIIDAALVNVYDSDKLLFFCGNGRYLTLNETWIYDINDNNWSYMKTNYQPQGRVNHKMVPINGTNQVLLFGGSNTSALFNDTWICEHTHCYAKNGTFISAPIEIGSNKTVKELAWDENTSKYTDIKFQLRSATSKASLASTNFVGPNGQTSSYYIKTQSMVWSGHKPDEWIQYKIYLSTNITKETPRLKKVILRINSWPEVIPMHPPEYCISTNSEPTFFWDVIDHDSEKQDAFQILMYCNNTIQNITIDSGEMISDEFSWQSPYGYNYSKIPDGSWHWQVRSKDCDGDWGLYSEPRKLIIDTYEPKSYIIRPIDGGFYNDLDKIIGTSSDNITGSGVVKVEISIQQQIDKTYWNGTSWSYYETWLNVNGTENWTYDTSVINWCSNIQYTIRSRAIDNASHIEKPYNEISFVYDTERPISKIEQPVNGAILNQLVKITGTAFDNGGSNIDRVETSIMCLDNNSYWNGSNWTCSEYWLEVNGTNNWEYNSKYTRWSTDKYYLIRSRAKDKATNLENVISQIQIMYDNQPPVNSIIINNGDKFTNSTLVDLVLRSEDSGSGPSQMSFSNDNIHWTLWEPFNNNKTIELLLKNGIRSIYCRVSDHAGNIAKPVYDSIILDSNPPEILSIVVNSDNEFTNNETVTLKIIATDLISGINNMSFSFDGKTWTTWEMFKPRKELNLSPDEGKKIVYIRVNDNAGNIANSSDTIVLDKSPPHSLSIIINSNANETNSRLVTLEPFAIDEISGLAKMSFKADEYPWGVWEDYSLLKDFILPSDNGIKIVYFRVTDKAGNVAEPVAVKIMLNKTEIKINSNDKGTIDEIYNIQNEKKSPHIKITNSYKIEINITETKPNEPIILQDEKEIPDYIEPIYENDMDKSFIWVNISIFTIIVILSIIFVAFFILKYRLEKISENKFFKDK